MGNKGAMIASPHAPGLHLLIDLQGCIGLTDAAFLEEVLRGAAAAAEATVIGASFHHFGGGGVTGVVLLAESHISIHTWPEHDFAALDIFMCGTARPDLARAHIEARLSPARSTVTEVSRGRHQRNQASQPAV